MRDTSVTQLQDHSAPGSWVKYPLRLTHRFRLAWQVLHDDGNTLVKVYSTVNKLTKGKLEGVQATEAIFAEWKKKYFEEFSETETTHKFDTAFEEEKAGRHRKSWWMDIKKNSAKEHQTDEERAEVMLQKRSFLFARFIWRKQKWRKFELYRALWHIFIFCFMPVSQSSTAIFFCRNDIVVPGQARPSLLRSWVVLKGFPKLE